MQLIGVIRFSFLLDGPFKAQARSMDEERRKLFNPLRIEQRFATLTHITLPALSAQTDQDFNMILLTSSELPEPYLIRLKALAQTVPNLSLMVLPPMQQRKAIGLALEPLKDSKHKFIGHFRLDDDDAIAVDFVEMTKSIFPRMKGLVAPRTSLDYNNGFLISAMPNAVHGKRVSKRQWTAAQIVFLRSQNPRNIITFPHHRMDQVMPTVTHPHGPMFVRTANGFNASRDFDHLGENGVPLGLPILKDTDTAVLWDRFRISVTDFQTAYAAANSLAAR